MVDRTIDLLATCPPRKLSTDGRTYLQEVIDVARWSEQAGFTGILIYTANAAQADPWLLAQVIIQNTHTICPLVAVQPIYMHPFTVAKLVSSLSNFYDRRIDLNLVAGGFKADLVALNDPAPHDQRYDRLIEYTSILKLLLGNSSAINYSGIFYSVEHLRLEPALPSGLFPRLFMAGSSTVGVAAARKLDALAMRYPTGTERIDSSVKSGIRVGVIARPEEEEAWRVARKRFPDDRKGQITHMLAMSVSDSVWHQRLSDMGEDTDQRRGPYWLGPFENYQEYCPYLVGSYQQVADALMKHIIAGNSAFIFDTPADGEELIHVKHAFALAMQVSCREKGGLERTEDIPAHRRLDKGEAI